MAELNQWEHIGRGNSTWFIPDNLGLTPEEELEEDPMTITDLIREMPQMPQVQYDVTRQLIELRNIANKFGLYDAADLLRDHFNL